MADYDKEIPFGDGVENRGVDDDDEIEMQNLDPYDSSSRRGSEDTTYRSSHSKTYGETSAKAFEILSLRLLIFDSQTETVFSCFVTLRETFLLMRQ